MLKTNFIIITPVYEDVEASSKLFQELAKEFDKNVYIVAVDDGSVKQPLDISTIRSAGLDGVALKLKRNVGHQRARCFDNDDRKYKNHRYVSPQS